MRILEHTPYWVWILFATLIALGVAQTRDRQMSLARVSIVPLAFIALSLSGVLRNGSPLIALAAWAVGCGAVLLFARQALAVRGARWSPDGKILNVPGSWVPLPLIVGLFAIKYVVAVTQAFHPTLFAELLPLAACNLIYGAFAGAFWSRAASLRRLARP